MSFILNPKDQSAATVTITNTLIDNLNFGFMGAVGKLDIITKHLTSDADVILYRETLFDDILKNSEFLKFTESLLEEIEPLVYLVQMPHESSDYGDNEMLFSSFRELLLFTKCIDFIVDAEKNLRAAVKSTGIHMLFDKAIQISNDEEYKNAKMYIEKTCNEINDIHSITIGINLDAQLCVQEAGIVSINNQKFTTNTLLDKMFAKKITDKNYICIEPIGSREMKCAGISMQNFNTPLFTAMSETVGKMLKKIKNNLLDFIYKNTNFLLDIYDDLKFITMCSYYTLSMQSSGMPLCIPKISENYHISDLYNPNLIGTTQSKNIVKNDVSFDGNGKIFILTGANSGGKSVYLRSVGIAQILFQLGLPIPAKSAEMQICTEIFSHFSSNAKDRSGGRFENECKSILSFYKDIRESSLVLLDEMFSTTGASEGTIIAVRMLKHFAAIGCKCIYSTHMHDLTANIDEINAQDDIKSRADGLSAEIVNETYTYRIKRIRESYGSYAEEICKKYGFTF